MAHIQLTTDGLTGKLLVDGHDISGGVRAVNFHLDSQGNELPRLTIELCAITMAMDSQQVQLELTEDAQAALTALGWTPPGS